MTLALTSADRLTIPAAVLDALRQAAALSDDAREMPVGGQAIDSRTHVQLGRMAALLPTGAVTLPVAPGNSSHPPAYTRDAHDLRAIMRALPDRWRIAFCPVRVIGRGTCWEAILSAPDDSAQRFTGRTMNTAALRALLAAVAALLLDHVESR